MKLKITLIVSTLLLLNSQIFAKCSSSKQYWRKKIEKAPTIEQFFIDNYSCKKKFYKALKSPEKLYFDTVLYPFNLTKRQYINRWLATTSSDKLFFKRFKFFNNYFNTHKGTITTYELHCFQKQLGFEEPVKKKIFFKELEKRGLSDDVYYLYPLIRWSYENVGIDMDLSAKRVELAEKYFGGKKRIIGDREQFARYIALFDREYESVARELSEKIGLSKIEAYKILVVLTFLESRGNLFAISKTGAFGPLQLTMHYYMLYGTPNNPFNPKSSLIKLANKFVHYNRIGKGIDESVIAYKSGSLLKCQDEESIDDIDCRYFRDFKNYMYKLKDIDRKDAISKFLTGKSYISKETNSLKRYINPHNMKYYEPFQYAVIKGEIKEKRRDGMLFEGGFFKTLGKMKRSDIYRLQDRYGVETIGVLSDKKVCY